MFDKDQSPSENPHEQEACSLHTVGELICSSGDIETSKNITVEDYFRQGIAGLSALHTKGYEFNYPELIERKQIFDK